MSQSTTHLTLVDIANGEKVAVLTMDNPPVSGPTKTTKAL